MLMLIHVSEFHSSSPLGYFNFIHIPRPSPPPWKTITVFIGLSRSSSGYFINHFWIQVAVSELSEAKRSTFRKWNGYKFMTVICNGQWAINHNHKYPSSVVPCTHQAGNDNRNWPATPREEGKTYSANIVLKPTVKGLPAVYVVGRAFLARKREVQAFRECRWRSRHELRSETSAGRSVYGLQLVVLYR
jgi:hypothetical protein